MSGGRDEDGESFDSTLIRSGKAALTFRDMQAFVHDLAERATGQFLADLPGLLALPEAKFNLVAMVLKKKIREPDRTHARAIVELLRTQAQTSSIEEVRERCAALLLELS